MLSEQNKVWSVYLIRTAQGTIYTGITTDVKRRFQEHQEGGRLAAKFLRGKGPLTLEFHSEAGSRAQALRLETRIKKVPRASKLKIISGELQLAEIA